MGIATIVFGVLTFSALVFGFVRAGADLVDEQWASATSAALYGLVASALFTVVVIGATLDALDPSTPIECAKYHALHGEYLVQLVTNPDGTVEWREIDGWRDRLKEGEHGAE